MLLSHLITPSLRANAVAVVVESEVPTAAGTRRPSIASWIWIAGTSNMATKSLGWCGLVHSPQTLRQYSEM